MQPARNTTNALLAIQQELVDREPIFHRTEFGTTREVFEGMMDDAFWETGASGKRYSKDDVLSTLEVRHSKPHDDPWQADDFYCQELGAETYLLTYTLRQQERLTRRATIWKRTESGWRIFYHQGTVVEPT